MAFWLFMGFFGIEGMKSIGKFVGLFSVFTSNSQTDAVIKRYQRSALSSKELAKREVITQQQQCHQIEENKNAMDKSRIFIRQLQNAITKTAKSIAHINDSNVTKDNNAHAHAQTSNPIIHINSS